MNNRSRIVALPLLLAVMYGAFELGRAFSALSEARRDLASATRFLAGVPAAEICGPGFVQARNLAVYGNVDGAGPRLLPGMSTAGIRLEKPAGCSGAVGPATVRLAARLEYRVLLWQLLGRPGAITLRLAQEQRWRGG